MKAMNLAMAAAVAAALFVAAKTDAQLRIAVVDTAQAIRQSEQAKGFAEQLNVELEPDTGALRELQDSIAALEKQVADEGDVMSDSQRRAVAKELENHKIDLDFGAKKLEKELQDRQGEFLQTMAPKVQAIVNDLVEIERYDFVFERRTVAYANPRHDITAKVTEKLNEQSSAEE